MPTIYDVADYCKVSPATVSLVLNGSARKVSQSTRAIVKEAARQLDYRPSAIARGLARKRMDALGILLPCAPQNVFGDLYFGAIANAVFGRAAELRQCLTIFPGGAVQDGVVHDIERTMEVLTDGRIDGLVLLVPGIDPVFKKALAASGLPVVEIGATPGPAGTPFVDCDNELGGYLATRHLIELGHKHIANITGHDVYVGSELRLRGYHKAMAEAHLPIGLDFVFHGRFESASGYQAAKAWLSKKPAQRPTAIVAADDVIAYGAMQAAAECGCSVPAQLSIVGFDDMAPSAVCSPPLTTVRQPRTAMGRTAVDILLAIIGQESIEQATILAPELVVRNSTGPAPAGHI